MSSSGATARRPGARAALALVVLALVAAACGGDDGDDAAGTAGTDGGSEVTTGVLVPVTLQLQWVAQAQFAGYYAALAEGYYRDEGLDLEIVEGGVDIVPQAQLANGAVDFALAWVPKALVTREEGADIVDIGQIFQRSGTLQVSWKDSGITSPADLAGKKVGNWGFGNEFELFAGLRQADVDPQSGVTLVQQQFDMAALLSREIDAAQAMIYNEYAQVLETVDPDTGELYQPEDLNVIDWNEVGTAMLQDAVWADAERLESDAEYRDSAVKLLKASMRGWAFCRDNHDECVAHVLEAGPTLGESHQSWQLAKVNELIWPSPDGIGVMDADLWGQTVSVATEEGIIAAAPEGDAYRTDLAEEAVAALEEDGVDVKGEGYEAPEVELREGGE